MKRINRELSIPKPKKINPTLSPLKRFFDLTIKPKETQKSPKKEAMDIVNELQELTLGQKLSSKVPIYNVNDVIGNYRLKKFLGSGTFGEVYLALDTQSNTDVAIKIQKVALSDRKNPNSPLKTDTDLFTKELMALSKLSSECSKFVCVYDSGLLSNKEKKAKGIPNDFCLYYIVTEFINGLTLDKFIEKKKGNYFDSDISFMLKNMVNGLFELHKFKIFHSDIKAENMMIDYTGHIKYLDFGLACDFNYKEDCFVAGTPGYMSPEYVEKRKSKEYVVDIYDVHINDWYSLAMVMYEVLSRKLIHRTFNDLESLPEAALDDIFKMDQSYLERNAITLSFIVAGLQRDPTKRFKMLLEWYDENYKHLKV